MPDTWPLFYSIYIIGDRHKNLYRCHWINNIINYKIISTWYLIDLAIYLTYQINQICKKFLRLTIHSNVLPFVTYMSMSNLTFKSWKYCTSNITWVRPSIIFISWLSYYQKNDDVLPPSIPLNTQSQFWNVNYNDGKI